MNIQRPCQLQPERADKPASWRRKVLLIGGALALAAALLSAAHSAHLQTKAWLAQQLLTSAWFQSRQQAQAAKPWPWADIQTVARLDVPSLDTSLVVLNDASGEALAFGPGLVGGDPLKADRQTIALGGHRDTHLAFLEHLPIGSLLFLETRDGRSHAYLLQHKQIVDATTHRLAIAQDAPALVLITCYPFNATQTGGPLRMVATALPLDAGITNKKRSTHSATDQSTGYLTMTSTDKASGTLSAKQSIVERVSAQQLEPGIGD